LPRVEPEGLERQRDSKSICFSYQFPPAQDGERTQGFSRLRVILHRDKLDNFPAGKIKFLTSFLVEQM
jgi:hypothetical protein